MFGLGEVTAREQKINDYVNHLNLLLADIRQAPKAAQLPASVNAAEQQFIQFSDKALEYSPFTQMTEAEFADFVGYADDVNQAMNEILYSLTPESPKPPVVASTGAKFDTSKLLLGLVVVAGVGGLLYYLSQQKMRPAFAGLRGDLVPFDNTSAVVGRLLKTREWKGSTVVDVGSAVEIRHPSGAKAVIQKRGQ